MRVSEIGKWDETVISSGIKTQKRSRKICVEYYINTKYENVMGQILLCLEFAEDKNFAPKQDESECPMT